MMSRIYPPDALAGKREAHYRCSFQPDSNELCRSTKTITKLNCSVERVDEMSWSDKPNPNRKPVSVAPTSSSPTSSSPTSSSPASHPDSLCSNIGCKHSFTSTGPPLSYMETVHPDVLAFIYYRSHSTTPPTKPRTTALLTTSSISSWVSTSSTELQTTPEPKPINPGALYTSWHCILPRSDLCNGISECLTDECNCNTTDVFYCADSAGCIAHANVCDGIEDCRDGSDECICSDVIYCTVKQRKQCVPRSLYCKNKDIGTYLTYSECIPDNPVKCPVTNKPKKHVLETCFDIFQSWANHDEISVGGGFSHKDLINFCKKNCDPTYVHFCGSISIQRRTPGFLFNCPKIKDRNRVISTVISSSELCDGTIDCDGGADESNCSGRFYCESNDGKKWIDSSEVCDNIKDCNYGEDECQNCAVKTNMSGIASDRSMVQNQVARYYMVVAAFLIISLNIFAGIEICQQARETRMAQVDQLILMTVCFYDMIMGCCVGFSFVKTMILSGKYCLHDSEWRSSLQCKLLGCFFSFSAHGSLFMISLMSLTRCYKCVFDR